MINITLLGDDFFGQIFNIESLFNNRKKKMKKVVLIYGGIAALIIGVVSILLLWTELTVDSAWLGYLIMLIGFSMIFVAIKQYRDKDLGGVITFMKAAQVGLLITLMASVFYVLCWEVYYQNAGQEFISLYQNTQVENMRASGVTEQEIDASIKEMQAFAKQYEQAAFRWFITLLEIVPVGLIITILSALLLKTKKSKQ